MGKAAVKDIGLLLKAARHKEVFFPAAWARYSEARPGTLRLVPPDARLPELQQDYHKMREMIFAEPPTFERLLEVLREIERQVNGGWPGSSEANRRNQDTAGQELIQSLMRFRERDKQDELEGRGSNCFRVNVVTHVLNRS